MEVIVALILVTLIITAITASRKLDEIIYLLKSVEKPLRDERIAEHNKAVWAQFQAERDDRAKQ